MQRKGQERLPRSARLAGQARDTTFYFASARPLKERPSLAAAADAAGFRTIWTEDGDAFVIMGYLADHVKRARLGTGIARAFARSTMSTATAAANMHAIMDGRFVLGLGTGTKRQNLYQLGHEYPHAGTRISALCDSLRSLWSADPSQSLHIDDQFETLRFDELALQRAHCDSPPPIFLAAVNDFMLRTAGRSCDGLCGHMCFSAPYLREVVAPAIEAGLADSGRVRSSFSLTSWVITSIDDDVRAARRRAAYQLAYYFSTKSYGGILSWHGFDGVQDQIRDALFALKDWELAADAISDEMIDVFALAGTANDCIDQLDRYEGALDEVVLYSHAAGPARSDASANLRRILQAFG